MRHVLLEAEDGPLLEMNRLVYNSAKNLRVVERARLLLVVRSLRPGVARVNRLINLRSLQDTRLDGVRLKVDVQVPVLHLLRVGDELVQVFDAIDTFWRLLEKTLTDVGHDALTLANLGRDTDQSAQLRRQINVLPFLTDFEQGLVDCTNGDVISRAEVVDHISAGALIAMVENVFLRVHVPLDLVHFVRAVRSVVGHDNSALELTINERGVVTSAALLNERQTVVNREELGYVVNDKVEAALEDPRGREETRPRLDLALENLCLAGHEETRVPTNLPQRRVSQTVLDDTVDEAEGDRVVLHLRVVQAVQEEGRALLNDDSVVATVERLRRLQRQAVLDRAHGEQVASDEDKLEEDLSQLISVRVDDLVLLECLKLAHGGS